MTDSESVNKVSEFADNVIMEQLAYGLFKYKKDREILMSFLFLQA